MNPAEELLDPLQGPQDPCSPISNDELLSQLAGQEINRLLAEVDQQLDAALGIEPQGPGPAPALALRRYPQPAARGLMDSAERPPQVGEAIGHLFDTLQAGRSSESSDSDPQDAADPPRGFEEVDPDEYAPAAAHAAEAPRRINLFDDDELVAFVERLPWFLRPLQWLNAPFEGLSIAALNALGRVAILSFVSAAALLTYVIVTTRP